MVRKKNWYIIFIRASAISEAQEACNRICHGENGGSDKCFGATSALPLSLPSFNFIHGINEIFCGC